MRADRNEALREGSIEQVKNQHDYLPESFSSHESTTRATGTQANANPSDPLKRNRRDLARSRSLPAVSRRDARADARANSQLDLLVVHDQFQGGRSRIQLVDWSVDRAATIADDPIDDVPLQLAPRGCRICQERNTRDRQKAGAYARAEEAAMIARCRNQRGLLSQERTVVAPLMVAPRLLLATMTHVHHTAGRAIEQWQFGAKSGPKFGSTRCGRQIKHSSLALALSLCSLLSPRCPSSCPLYVVRLYRTNPTHRYIALSLPAYRSLRRCISLLSPLGEDTAR